MQGVSFPILLPSIYSSFCLKCSFCFLIRPDRAGPRRPFLPSTTPAAPRHAGLGPPGGQVQGPARDAAPVCSCLLSLSSKENKLALSQCPRKFSSAFWVLLVSPCVPFGFISLQPRLTGTEVLVLRLLSPHVGSAPPSVSEDES